MLNYNKKEDDQHQAETIRRQAEDALAKGREDKDQFAQRLEAIKLKEKDDKKMEDDNKKMEDMEALLAQIHANS